MAFSDDFKNFSKKALKLKKSIKTKSEIKYTFIMPFLQLLGYSIFDPEELAPEYVLDRANDLKVDYALLCNKEPIIIIEVMESISEEEEYLEKLGKCFNALKRTEFAILTNGIIYKFFLSSSEPVLAVNLEQLNEYVLIELEKFHKKNFKET